MSIALLRSGTAFPRTCLLLLALLVFSIWFGFLFGQLSPSTHPSWSLTSFSFLPPKIPCSDKLSKWQLDQWKDAVKHQRLWMACPDHKWLNALAGAWTRNDFVVFDIGCNKGYETSQYVQALAPHLPLTNKALFIALQRASAKHKLHNDGLCGACVDCLKQPPHSFSPLGSFGLRNLKRGQLRLHCFEPSDSNFKLVSGVRKTIVPDAASSQVNLTLHQLALSDKPGMTKFPTGCGEHCSLGQMRGFPTVLVNVSTVDVEMERLGVEFIDILKVDTEGYDPLVLSGASSAFNQQRVGVVLFEHHSLGVWNHTQLSKVVGDMRQFGYVCYYDGRPYLTQLTECWDDRYNGKGWSNVVCVMRTHPSFKAFHHLSFRSARNAPS